MMEVEGRTDEEITLIIEKRKTRAQCAEEIRDAPFNFFLEPARRNLEKELGTPVSLHIPDRIITPVHKIQTGPAPLTPLTPKTQPKQQPLGYPKQVPKGKRQIRPL